MTWAQRHGTTTSPQADTRFLPGPPTLAVVIPSFNAGQWLEETIQHLRNALRIAEWDGVQIIVVDDGSTDDTDAVGARLASNGVLMLHQANSGRFLARRAGMLAAHADFVLLLDSRVHVGPESMAFVREQLTRRPERRVWNGHVSTAPSRSLVAYFWDAVTYIAWRRYYRAPRLVGFGSEDFDHYPKGTGMFLAPRELLLKLCDAFDTESADLREANDDTLLLRPLASEERIFLSPQFDCTYHAREGLRPFLAHSYHRGKVLIDGHLRPGARFRPPILVTLIAMPLVLLLTLARPRLIPLVWAVVSSALAAVAASARAPRRATQSLVVLWPLFTATYAAGMYVAMWRRRWPKPERGNGFRR